MKSSAIIVCLGILIVATAWFVVSGRKVKVAPTASVAIEAPQQVESSVSPAPRGQVADAASMHRQERAPASARYDESNPERDADPTLKAKRDADEQAIHRLRELSERAADGR